MACKLNWPCCSKLGEHGESGTGQAAAQAQKPQVCDEVDEQLLPILIAEADELLPKIGEGLRAWHEHPDNEQQLLKVARLLHTVKGSARMSGAMRIGELAHSMEDCVQFAMQSPDQAEHRGVLDSDFDTICNLIEALRGGNVKATIADAIKTGEMATSMDINTTRSRTVPFSSISERLYRIVRQTGKELNKRANLELSGTGIELDRNMLDKMTAPFEHLLRNAMVHGLEAPERRERAGKPAIGEIYLSLRHENNEAVFELRDDGAGLDMVRLQQKALALGLLREGETISTEQAIELIFKPGISTAQEVTEIAGRGVGLDVVRSEISALGGYLDVFSNPGNGVCFTIHLPLLEANL
jgi:chemosensory pili system protein ChpA (sensor histidine kinase/response regulator)